MSDSRTRPNILDWQKRMDEQDRLKALIDSITPLPGFRLFVRDGYVDVQDEWGGVATITTMQEYEAWLAHEKALDHQLEKRLAYWQEVFPE